MRELTVYINELVHCDFTKHERVRLSRLLYRRGSHVEIVDFGNHSMQAKTINIVPSRFWWSLYVSKTINKSRLSLIVRVNVVLNRTVVVDSD